MAHFAKIENGNIVEQVIVVSNDIAINEEEGINFLKTLYNEPNSVWKQTSYNGNIRKNFAGIGYIYDEQRDAFIPPKPYNSWILDENICQWKAPILEPKPIDGKKYNWNESTLTWDIIEI